MLLSCNPTVQFCRGTLGYSSRTVILSFHIHSISCYFILLMYSFFYLQTDSLAHSLTDWLLDDINIIDGCIHSFIHSFIYRTILIYSHNLTFTTLHVFHDWVAGFAGKQHIMVARICQTNRTRCRAAEGFYNIDSLQRKIKVFLMIICKTSLILHVCLPILSLLVFLYYIIYYYRYLHCCTLFDE